MTIFENKTPSLNYISSDPYEIRFNTGISL